MNPANIILPEDIASAIEERLRETFHGETVYRDWAPRDFVRPSNLVELVKFSVDPLSIGLSAVELQYQYKITTFSEVDEVHYSHFPLLDLRAMLVVSAFAGGTLRVKDRAPHITEIKADPSLLDCAEVLLAIRLSMDRAAFLPEELYGLMKDIAMKINEKELKP